MFKINRFVLVISLLLTLAPPAWAEDSDWEYQVVILQGITAGGTMEKQSSGVYIDKKRTAALNELAANGWEVVSVIGAPGIDHAVYLKRQKQK